MHVLIMIYKQELQRKCHRVYHQWIRYVCLCETLLREASSSQLKVTPQQQLLFLSRPLCVSHLRQITPLALSYLWHRAAPPIPTPRIHHSDLSPVPRLHVFYLKLCRLSCHIRQRRPPPASSVTSIMSRLRSSPTLCKQTASPVISPPVSALHCRPFLPSVHLLQCLSRPPLSPLETFALPRPLQGSSSVLPVTPPLVSPRPLSLVFCAAWCFSFLGRRCVCESERVPSRILNPELQPDVSFLLDRMCLSQESPPSPEPGGAAFAHLTSSLAAVWLCWQQLPDNGRVAITFCNVLFPLAHSKAYPPCKLQLCPKIALFFLFFCTASNLRADVDVIVGDILFVFLTLQLQVTITTWSHENQLDRRHLAQ